MIQIGTTGHGMTTAIGITTAAALTHEACLPASDVRKIIIIIIIIIIIVIKVTLPSGSVADPPLRGKLASCPL